MSAATASNRAKRRHGKSAAPALSVTAVRPPGILGRPVETVRGWVRRFGGRAEAVRVAFTALLVGAGV